MKFNMNPPKVIFLALAISCSSAFTMAQRKRNTYIDYTKEAPDTTSALKRGFVSDTVDYVKGSVKKKQPRVEVKPQVIVTPPSLEILSLEPLTPVSGQPLVVNFRFSNDDILKKPRTGFIRAKASKSGQSITDRSDTYPVGELQPGETIMGNVTIKTLTFERQGIVELEYFDTYNSFYNKFLKKNINQSQLLSSDEQGIIVSPPFIDLDKDGINDREENRLLAKFRPYYRFSKHYGNIDDYRPTDVLWFLQRSELLTSDNEDDHPIIDNKQLASNPSLLLFTTGSAPWIIEIGSSDLTENHRATKYHVNPIQDVPNISDENPGRHGPSWSDVMAAKNIGLYGHVVPLRLNSASDYDRKHKSPITGNEKEFIKVEYWQFFGYNECHCGAWVHEGDWITVQVLFDPSGASPDSVASVYYYVHGALEIKFNMALSQAPIPVSLNGTNDSFVEFRGPNYGNHCHADTKAIQDSDCSNNTMRFSQDPLTGHFTHPVAYIENGAHEPWPTSEGFFAGVPNHDGNDYDHSYLTNAPPNLGEVDAVMNVPGAMEILRFNGSWGAQGGGARGPSLHWQWTWPDHSSTRSQIADDQFTD